MKIPITDRMLVDQGQKEPSLVCDCPNEPCMVHSIDRPMAMTTFNKEDFNEIKGERNPLIAQAKEEGRQEERERTLEIIRKERDTWARESIGDKALQSLLTALTPTKDIYLLNICKTTANKTPTSPRDTVNTKKKTILAENVGVVY
jgi:hypothetical protein